ncbi:MAG: hypothetical protein NC222_06480 [Staphylococcus sp.]|nr:hypothetical protein [Staphylococcus sp.]
MEKFEIGYIVSNKEYTEAAIFCNKSGDRHIEQKDDKYVIVKNEVIDNSKEIEVEELQKYLNDTDWYIIRKQETLVEVPEDILESRQAARLRISELREEMEESK